MKLTRTSLAIIAAVSVLSLTPAVHAQTNAPGGAPRTGGGAGGGRRSVDEQVTALSERLKLTDAQKPKVKAILEEQTKKGQELRADTSLSQDESRTKRQALREDTNKKMKELLTPEQDKQWEEQQQRGRRNGGGAGGAGGAPGGGTNN
jgi:Spy/CpxP family protein refolding chaperone